MTRALLALMVFCVAAAATYGVQLRSISSWSDVCFQNEPGREIRLAELLSNASWDWGALVAASAPYLPYLFFAVMTSFGGNYRHAAMICAMLCTVAFLVLGSGPVTRDLCNTKGPYPEVGQILFGLVVSFPLALGLAWMTRSRPAKP